MIISLFLLYCSGFKILFLFSLFIWIDEFGYFFFKVFFVVDEIYLVDICFKF